MVNTSLNLILLKKEYRRLPMKEYTLSDWSFFFTFSLFLLCIIQLKRFLHCGHVFSFLLHCLMHRWWYLCLQQVIRVSSFLSIFTIQIQHILIGTFFLLFFVHLGIFYWQCTLFILRVGEFHFPKPNIFIKVANCSFISCYYLTTLPIKTHLVYVNLFI